MKTVQIGIIGCGAIAKIRHLPECKEHEDVTIYGVCDVNEERVQRFARAYKTKAFTDYHEMLASPELDAVIICLPHHLHATVAIDAANAGKHILVEKPIATNVEDARKMVKAAEENRVNLMVAHNQRFVPSHVKAKEWLDRGELGKVYSFQSTFGHNGPENWSIDGEKSFYMLSKEEGFGVLGDLAIHKVDLLHFLLGVEVSEAHVITGSIAKDNSLFEDNALLSLKMENGVIGSITASWSYVHPDFSTVIHCEKGTIHIENDPTYPLIIKFSDGTALNYDIPSLLSYEKQLPGRSQVVSSFIDSIVQHKAPPVTGNDGLRALKVVLEAMKKSESILT